MNVYNATNKNIIVGMKKLFYISILILFSACSKQEEIIETTDNEDNIILDNSDLSGVWTSLSNDEYFISFTEGGKYTFCLNDHLMGSGTYNIKDNVATLNNSYTNKTDKIKIELSQNTINIKGDIFLFNSENKETIQISLTKSEETISPSQIGVEHGPGMYGLNKYYDITYIGVQYLTDTFAKYECRGIHKTTKKEKVIKSYSWYYVYRKPYTYTQEIDGDGTITKYDFENGWPDYL